MSAGRCRCWCLCVRPFPRLKSTGWFRFHLLLRWPITRIYMPWWTLIASDSASCSSDLIAGEASEHSPANYVNLATTWCLIFKAWQGRVFSAGRLVRRFESALPTRAKADTWAIPIAITWTPTCTLWTACSDCLMHMGFARKWTCGCLRLQMIWLGPMIISKRSALVSSPLHYLPPRHNGCVNVGLSTDS